LTATTAILFCNNFASIREMDSLAPARSALAGLRLCQIPFTGGIHRSRTVGLTAFASGKSFSAFPKCLKSQPVQVVSYLASWRLPTSLHFGVASGVKTS
jgi:hypothetical protein